MRRARIVVDRDRAVAYAERLPLLATAVEEARRFAEAADDELQQAYWEGQRDLIAAQAKDVCRREVYEVSEAEHTGPSDHVLRAGLPFLPIPTPKDKSLWK